MHKTGIWLFAAIAVILAAIGFTVRQRPAGAPAGVVPSLGDRAIHISIANSSAKETWLHQAVGPFEGVIVSAVCRAVQEKDWSAVSRANDLLQASLTPSTLRSASREMGQQLLALAEAWAWASASDELKVMSDESSIISG